MLKIDKNAELLLVRLGAAGIRAYIAGGCVRDSLRGAEPKDWDIAAEAVPEEFTAALDGLRLLTNGLKHGTVTAVLDGQPYEITACRSEGGYADHRHPDSVRFTRSIESDLARRDFTINAMAYSPQSGLIDLHGGVDDLKKGLLRCVGEPEARFREDALRILRALRFSSELGYEIEPATAAAALRLRESLSAVSWERKYAELKRLICGDGAGEVLDGFSEIIFELLPECAALRGLYHRESHGGDLWRHSIAPLARLPRDAGLRFAALLRDCGKSYCEKVGDGYPAHPEKGAELAAVMLKRLKAERDVISRVQRLVACHDLVIPPEPVSVKRALNRLGRATFFDLLTLREADPENRGERSAETRALAEAIIADGGCFELSTLAVNGRDLEALGYRGAEVGRVLATLLSAVIEGECENEKGALIAHIK